MCVGSFRLEHPELGQMAASLGFLSTKCRPECVHFAERRSRRFHVELARLRQISFLIVDIVHFKERGRSFASCGSEYRRIRERITLAVHINSRAELCLRAYAQYGSLPRRANPKMAAIQEKIYAVLLQLNRVGF